MASHWFICLNMLAVKGKIGFARDCSRRQTELCRTEASALAFLTGEPGELWLLFLSYDPNLQNFRSHYLHLMWLYSHGDTFYCGSFDIHLNVGLILGFSFCFYCLIIFLLEIQVSYHCVLYWQLIQHQTIFKADQIYFLVFACCMFRVLKEAKPCISLVQG